MFADQNISILEQLKAAYIAHRWVRWTACAVLLAAAILLSSLAGGFPPWAWRFLLQVLPQVPVLWEQKGVTIIPPLAGLVLLAVTFFVLWGMLALVTIRIVRYWWRERQQLQAFQEDLEDAELLSLRMQQEQESRGARSLPGRHAMAASPAPSTPNGSSPSATGYRRPGYDHQDISLLQTPLTRKNQRHVRFDVGTDKGYGDPEGRPRPGNSVAVAEPRFRRSSIHLEVGTGLDVGIKRRGQPNEDSLLALPQLRIFQNGPQPVGLFVVADGMGGYGNGQEASRLAIQALSNALKLALVDGLEDDIYEELLAEAVHNANLAVYQRNRQKQANMGTTITALLIVGNTAYAANVGDSRTYLYRDTEGLSQITRDHSAVARLVEAGAISAEEVYSHPRRNEIYRSLGHNASVKVDTFTLPLKIGDVLLLCSDGLWEMVRDAEIAHIIASSLPYASQMCAMLVHAALNRGGKDNISVIVVCVRND